MRLPRRKKESEPHLRGSVRVYIYVVLVAYGNILPKPSIIVECVRPPRKKETRLRGSILLRVRSTTAVVNK